MCILNNSNNFLEQNYTLKGVSSSYRNHKECDRIETEKIEKYKTSDINIIPKYWNCCGRYNLCIISVNKYLLCFAPDTQSGTILHNENIVMNNKKKKNANCLSRKITDI